MPSADPTRPQAAKRAEHTTPSELYFHQAPVGEMANFAYLVGSHSTREAVLVDPAWDVGQLLARAEADGMNVVGALFTHYHPDHVGGKIFGLEIEGVARLLELAPMPLHVQDAEAEGFRRITGASESDVVRRRSGDRLELGPVSIRMLHTPGHTPGSQCFLVEEQTRGPGLLVSGDTLFLGSCGRVDLPGSDPEAMYRSLNEVLKALPDATRIFPGHSYASEPSGTLAEQKRTNPYLRVTTLAQFLQFMGY